MNDAYIIDGLRSPIGKLKGSLASVRPDDLAAQVIQALMGRHPNIDPAEIGDVVLGCANQAGEDNRNVARMSLLLAGLPTGVPGETINRLCASGLSAAVHAARAIRLGEADLMISGGVESMTRAPLVMGKAERAYSGQTQIYDSSFGWRFINPRLEALYGVEAMGQTAENLAELHRITREDQDRFAYESQRKTARAQASGRLEKEIVGIFLQSGKGEQTEFSKDEFPKNQTNTEVLAGLNSAFRQGGTVTAGNSSGLNDGAAATLLASEAGIQRYGLKPLARVLSSAVVGVEPRYMGIGPVPASKRALEKAGLTLDQIDVIELNEAFSAQVLACIRSWGLADDDPRLNPNGGAIALGHPLGMTGARILNSAALELQLQAKRYALVTMCVGVGQGFAVVLERV